MKKRLFLFFAMSLLCYTGLKAQGEDFKRGVFDRVGVQVSAGTEGIGFSVASNYKSVLELSLGVNIIPSIKINKDFDVDNTVSVNDKKYTFSKGVEGKIDFKRTTFDLKANYYPFGGNSLFFVAAGFSFGGATIAEFTGHSDEVKEQIASHPELEGKVGIELGKNKISIDKNGDVKGELRVNSFRPYLGLGFGRAIPKHRVGVRFELGCQFMGKLKVYQNGSELNIDDLSKDTKEVSNIVDKLKFYPVLKLGVTTRIL